MILLILAISYLASAGLLAWLKSQGESVPWIWPTAWLVCGIAGVAIALLVERGVGWPMWVATLLVFVPILAVSTVVDVRLGYWWIVALDVAGLAAAVWALVVLWP
jgi:hypothetical protein